MDRGVSRQVGRWTGGQRGRWTEEQMGRLTEEHVHRWTEGHVHRWTEGQVGRGSRMVAQVRKYLVESPKTGKSKGPRSFLPSILCFQGLHGLQQTARPSGCSTDVLREWRQLCGEIEVDHGAKHVDTEIHSAACKPAQALYLCPPQFSHMEEDSPYLMW